MNRYIIKLLSILGLLAISAASWAQVSHISINQTQFKLGGYPKMKLNIVSTETRADRLEFTLSQASGDERLMVKSVNDFLLQLTGVEDVIDPKAELVIREYRVDSWHLIKRIALFDADAKYEKKSLIEPVSKTTKAIATLSVASQASNHDQASNQQQASCELSHTADTTLWSIASEQGKQWGLSTYGALLAIYDSNPKAFNKGKINSLRADTKLKCPSIGVREKYADANHAKQVFESL